MINYTCIAIFNGMIIGASRSINGRLSIEIGPLKASFWNHIVGFVFLTFLLIIFGEMKFDEISKIAPITLLGGVFGALFVAVNSYVLPRIGATKTILLVISAQMIAGVLIDNKNVNVISMAGQFFGIAAILIGIYLAKLSSAKSQETSLILNNNIINQQSLVNTLLDDKSYHIEFNGHLTNHNKHAVIALNGLGASSARIQSYYDNYAKCTPYGYGLEAAKISKYFINQDNWIHFLGKRTSFFAYCQFFDEQEKELGFEKLLKKYLPTLIPGWAGAFTHGTIHLGWALDVNHRWMIIEGLAYMAFSYMPCYPERILPNQKSENSTLLSSLLEVADAWEDKSSGLKKWVEETLTREDPMDSIHPELKRSGLQYKIAKLLGQGHSLIYVAYSWQEYQEISEIWKQFRYAITLLYLAYPRDFIILHLITSLHAMEHIVVHLSVEQQRLAIKSFWIGTLCILFSRCEFPKRATLETLHSKFKDAFDSNAVQVESQHWTKIIELALNEEEEHNPKLVYVLRRMWRMSEYRTIFREAAEYFTTTPILPKSFELQPIEE